MGGVAPPPSPLPVAVAGLQLTRWQTRRRRIAAGGILLENVSMRLGADSNEALICGSERERKKETPDVPRRES